MTISLFLFAIIGFVFGLIGAGGSIFSIPVLIYVMNLNSQVAISYSFYIVGFISFLGFLKYLKKDLVNFKDAIIFGLPSIIAVAISRYFIVDLIPLNIFGIKKENLLITLFSILIIISGILILLKKERQSQIFASDSKKNIKTMLSGLLVGLISGTLGAGGGFLIIPALHHFLKMDIKKSIGTSLFIIFLNSCIAVAADIFKNYFVEISILVPIILASAIGLLIGIQYTGKIDDIKIKKGLAIFTIITGFFMLIKELIVVNYSFL